MKYRMHFILLTITFFLFNNACNSDSDAQMPVSTVPYSIILSGPATLSGKFENRKIEIFKDKDSLDSSLALYTNPAPAPEHPIDFSMSQAVLINMGLRPNTGYSIEIDQIEDHADYIILRIVMVKAGSNCAVGTMITSPHIFIEIKSTKEILIRENLETQDCE